MYYKNQNFDRVGYLQYLCNSYGDFKVAYSCHKLNGDVVWSKHRSILDCWRTDSGLKFLEMVNHRQILPCEIVIDIDDPTINYMNICDVLEKRDYDYECYQTGSRGHHIHIYIPTNKFNDKNHRECLRSILITKLKGDIHKKSDNVMIALENVPHWKTGNIKKMVRSYGRSNYIRFKEY